MASRLDGVEADMQSLQKNQQQLETSSRTFQAHQSEVAETFESHENSMSTLDEDVVRLKEELNRLAEAQAAISKTAVPQPSAETDKEDGKETGQAVAIESGGMEAEEESEGPVVLAEGQPAAGGERSNFDPRSTIAGDNATREPSASPARGQPAAGGERSNFDQRSTITGDNTKSEPSAFSARGQPTEAELTDPERSREAQEYIDFVESTTAKFFRLVKEGFVNLWQWFISLFA